MIENKEQIILNQWQVCVEMANSISQRRDTSNNVFITLNIAFSGFMLNSSASLILLCFIGFILCIIWFSFINNFKRLNREKFAIIKKLEEYLPTKPFTDEEIALLNDKKYENFTDLECLFPFIFGIFYAFIYLIKELFNV